MKRLLSTGMVFIFCTAASGSIIVDGNISDWDSRYVYEDSDTDAPGEAEMTRWGCFVENGTLYAFFEMNKTIDTYTSEGNDLWAGIHINVDLKGGVETGPGSDPSAVYYQPGWRYADGGWNNCAGMDINVEWGVNEGHWGEGFNFWGAGDDIANRGSAVSEDGQKAYDEYIVEFSCPISEIIAELGLYPDGVEPGLLWQVGARVEASLGGCGVWGGDYADDVRHIDVPQAPEPATFSLLCVGAVAVCRRRK